MLLILLSYGGMLAAVGLAYLLVRRNENRKDKGERHRQGNPQGTGR